METESRYRQLVDAAKLRLLAPEELDEYCALSTRLRSAREQPAVSPEMAQLHDYKQQLFRLLPESRRLMTDLDAANRLLYLALQENKLSPELHRRVEDHLASAVKI